jgi:hypothetical protein
MQAACVYMCVCVCVCVFVKSCVLFVFMPERTMHSGLRIVNVRKTSKDGLAWACVCVLMYAKEKLELKSEILALK